MTTGGYNNGVVILNIISRGLKAVRTVLTFVFSMLLVFNISGVKCGTDYAQYGNVSLDGYIDKNCPKTVKFEQEEYKVQHLPQMTKMLLVDGAIPEELLDSAMEDGAAEEFIDITFPETAENPYLSELLGILDNSDSVLVDQLEALDIIQIENDMLMQEVESELMVYKDDSIEGVKLQYIGNNLALSSEIAYDISECIKNGLVVDKSLVDSLVNLEQYKADMYKSGEIEVLDNATDKYSRIKPNADKSITKGLDLTTDWLDISDEKRDRMNSLCTGVPMYSTSDLINEMVADVINTYCTDDMTPADKAYTCYKYIMANTKYAKYNYSQALYDAIGVGGDGEWVDSKGKVQWTKRRSQSYAVARAYSMLSDSINRGACDNYSVATVACFRALGFDARVVAKNGVHFWVEVVDPNTGDSYVFDNELQGKGQNIEHTNEDAPYNEFFCSTYAEAKTYWNVYTQGSMAQGMSYAKCSDYNSIFNIDSPIYEGTYAYNVAMGVFE